MENSDKWKLQKRNGDIILLNNLKTIDGNSTIYAIAPNGMRILIDTNSIPILTEIIK